MRKFAAYVFSRVPSEAELSELSRSLLAFSAQFQLVNRDMDAQAADMDPRLSAALLSIRESSEWPGTLLLYGGRALIFSFDSSAQVLESGLNLFRVPADFEDVAFYRADSSIIAGSCMHEGDYWFYLTHAEREAMDADLPGLLRYSDRDVPGVLSWRVEDGRSQTPSTP